MIKKLAAFGCSWVYGGELVDPELIKQDPDTRDFWIENQEYRLEHCFAGIVAKHYGLELVNLAMSGSSLESMRFNLFWYLKNFGSEETFFLAGLTDPARQSWFNPRHQHNDSDPAWNRWAHSAWLNDSSTPPDFYNLQKQWVALCCHRDWEEFNYVETLHQFDHIATRYNAPVLQVNCLTPPPNVTQIVPTLMNPGDALRDWLDRYDLTTDLEVFAPRHHANELGNQILAQQLINYIDSCKILEC